MPSGRVGDAMNGAMATIAGDDAMAVVTVPMVR